MSRKGEKHSGVVIMQAETAIVDDVERHIRNKFLQKSRAFQKKAKPQDIKWHSVNFSIGKKSILSDCWGSVCSFLTNS
jgi:hypothetical protein